jgi:transposase
MDAREQRGRTIAEHAGLIQKGKVWLVPSQSGTGKRYTVVPDAEKPHCSCADHETRGVKCKHIHAVEITMTKTEQNDDGSTTVTTVTVKAERKTYSQPWAEYNAAQVNERGHFHELLADLCGMVPEPARKPGRGRKPVSYADGLFSAILKVYSLMSARRFSGELAEAHERGFISRLPHFNSVLNVFDNADVTPILKGMVETAALPLREIETIFATDSTGFAGSSYHRWFDKKYGGLKSEVRWVKAHLTTGVRTNVVTALDVLQEDSPDSPQLPGLAATTAKNFTIKEMSADKAYTSNANFVAVESHGGTFYPMFRVNATGKGSTTGSSFVKTLHYFGLHRDEYLQHYHQRSNVESTVSMVKRKFGGNLRSKNETSMRNECYAKFVCHNICVLIQEMYVLGIDPTFGKGCTIKDESAQLLRFPGS